MHILMGTVVQTGVEFSGVRNCHENKEDYFD